MRKPPSNRYARTERIQHLCKSTTMGGSGESGRLEPEIERFLPDINTWSTDQRMQLVGRVLDIVEQKIHLASEKERTRRAELYTAIRLREIDRDEKLGKHKHDEAMRQLENDREAMLKGHDKEMEVIRRNAERSVVQGDLMRYVLQLRGAGLLTHDDLAHAFDTITKI